MNRQPGNRRVKSDAKDGIRWFKLFAYNRWAWWTVVETRCNVSWAAYPEWGDRRHVCDLQAGHEGDHVCGWCIACEFGAETLPANVEIRSQP